MSSRTGVADGAVSQTSYPSSSAALSGQFSFIDVVVTSLIVAVTGPGRLVTVHTSLVVMLLPPALKARMR
jgi:hypothetical protein